MIKKREPIDFYAALYGCIESEIENREISGNGSYNVSFEVEGIKDGELVVADFDGEIHISNYYCDDGDYYTPPCCDYDVEYEGDLTWYADEDCTIQKTEHVKDRL